MKTIWTLTILSCAALVGGACDERSPRWDRERAVIGPVPLADAVAYVDSALDRVVIADASSGEPVLRDAAIGRRAIFATASPDRTHLAVITRGEEARYEYEVDQPPMLWWLDAAGDEPGGYPLGSPFDRLAIAADGSLAVAYFSGAGPDDEGFFRNPNELAVIDLSAPAGEANPVLQTLRSFGAAPEGVVLSPPMVVPGADDATPRIFAFVLSADTITVLDATHPDTREASLRLGTGDTVLQPREVVFAPGTATAYVRSDNARDVLEVTIGADERDATDARDNDFRPALAELGAGAGPADIDVYDDREGRRRIIAATPGSREVVIIDADTAQFVTVATPDPIDRIVLFPRGPGVVPHTALLASIGSQLPRVHLVALDDIDDTLTGIDVETVALTEPVLDVVPVPGRELAMLVHDARRTVLGLLDIAVGSVAPLQGVGRLDEYTFSADGRHLIGATSGVARVGYVALDNLHPSDLRLDDVPTDLIALPGGGLWLDHGDPLGRATFVPKPGAARDDARVLSGFLLNDYLDEEL